MREPSDEQLRRKQQNQISAMADTLLHRSRTWEDNEYNEQEEIIVDAEEYPAGFDLTATSEKDEQDETRIIDAMVRLPLEVEGVIKATDQVVMTRRYRRMLDRMPIFEVIGEPLVGSTAIQLKLREVI